MNDVLPEGLRITDGLPFTKSSDSLMAAITRADYHVALTPHLVDTLARGENLHRVRQELETNLRALLESTEWMVAKQSHGQKGKVVNAVPQ